MVLKISFCFHGSCWNDAQWDCKYVLLGVRAVLVLLPRGSCFSMLGGTECLLRKTEVNPLIKQWHFGEQIFLCLEFLQCGWLYVRICEAQAESRRTPFPKS